MAQTGYTPILIYSSSTVSQAPSAGNLTNSTLGSELAINITDGKLFYKDNANAVQVIGWKTTPTTAGGTGLTSYTAGDLLYYATGTTLSKLAIGASTTILTSSGTAPQWSAASGITVGKATNLDGGAAGSVPYQSSAGATTFLGIGAANTVMTSSGTAPQWSTSLSLAGSVTATTFIPTSGTAPTNGMYLYTTNTLGWATNSSFRMQLGSGGLSINTTTSNAQLTVLSQVSNTGIPSAGNATAWLMNDPGSVVANAGGALTFAARTRGSPNEIQAMAGLKGAKLNANDDEIAGYLAFYTANNSVRTLVEQMRLWNTGGLSIGNTTDPGAGVLSVSTATWSGPPNSPKIWSPAIAIGNSTDWIQAYSTGFYFNTAFYVVNTTPVGVYMNSGATAWSAYSDARLKTVTGVYQNALDDIDVLEPVKFVWNWDKDKKPCVGLNAASVEKVIPEAIDKSKLQNTQDDTEYLTVRYTETIPLLVAAIQELKAKLKAAGVAGF